MCQESLTERIAIESFRAFFREKPFLFFGSGMSCALDTRFGMESLKNTLLEQIKSRSLTDYQKRQWDGVETALHSGSDLESALSGVNDQDLLRVITNITGAFISSIDREHAFQIAKGSSEWPATHFLKLLVVNLPEGDPILHALTPNYDMLFEYACDCEDIPYTNGFSGCIQRKTDWRAADQSLLIPEKVTQGRRKKAVFKHRKHVRLYKVHGSLNYFFHRNAVIENNAWMWSPPDYAQRVMITPGLSKYETLQRYRRELLSSADAMIDKANHFLFLGYGFNDKHLEEYIKRKLVNQHSKGLIITRDSNPRIESLLTNAPNLWLVCKEQDPTQQGTRIFNRRYPGWLSLPDKQLWDIGEFTALVLGG